MLPDDRSNTTTVPRSARCAPWMLLLMGTLLAGAADAAPGNAEIVRDLASRVGPIVGSA